MRLVRYLEPSIFIDGTKIEAYANKYNFVWKKAVIKNMVKLLIKIADLVEECEELYDIKLIYKNTVQMKHVKKLRERLYGIKKSECIEFVYGSGKRKNHLQKSIEKLEDKGIRNWTPPEKVELNQTDEIKDKLKIVISFEI